MVSTQDNVLVAVYWFHGEESDQNTLPHNYYHSHSSGVQPQPKSELPCSLSLGLLYSIPTPAATPSHDSHMTRPLSDLCDLSPGQKGHTEVCILLDFYVKNKPSASMSRSELQEVGPQGQMRAVRDSRWWSHRHRERVKRYLSSQIVVALFPLFSTLIRGNLH